MLEWFKDKFSNFGIGNKLFIFSILMIGLVIFMYFYNSTTLDDKFVRYVTFNDYYNENGGYLYYKTISSNSLEKYNYDVDNGNASYYEVNYFDINARSFNKIIREYDNGIESSLNSSFSFKNRVINYSYRAVLNQEATIIYSGSLKNGDRDTFTCSKDYSYLMDVSDYDSDICNTVKNNIIDFYYESINSIKNDSLVNRLSR